MNTRVIPMIRMVTIFFFVSLGAQAQNIHKVTTDSLMVTNDSAKAELILENSSRNVKGFLYNTGNGRTEFRRGMLNLGDTQYVFGSDTLKIRSVLPGITVRNGLNNSHNAIELGGPLSRADTIFALDSSLVFQFNNGSYKKIGAIGNYLGTIEKFTNGRYHVFTERSAASNDYWNWSWSIDTVARNFTTSALEPNFGMKVDHIHYSVFNGYNPRPGYTRNPGDKGIRLGLDYENGLYVDTISSTHQYINMFRIGFDGKVRLYSAPNDGTAGDSVMVWNNADKELKKVAPKDIVSNAAQTIQSLTDSSTILWNASKGLNGTVTLGGSNRTISITNSVAGRTYHLKIVQDGSGNRTIGTWPAGTIWPSGTIPTLSTAPAAIDLVTLYFDGTNYYGDFKGNFQATPLVSIQAFDAKTNSTATVHNLTNVPAGALLVLVTASSTSQANATISSSPSLSWTKRVEAQGFESGDAEIYTAVFPAGGTISITSNWGNTYQSSVCYTIINQESVLNGASANVSLQSTPNLSITTTKGNSLIIGVVSDWNAVDGASRTYRDSITETLYGFSNNNATFYHFYRGAATTTTYTEGLSAPAGQSAGTCLLEIRGN